MVGWCRNRRDGDTISAGAIYWAMCRYQLGHMVSDWADLGFQAKRMDYQFGPLRIEARQDMAAIMEKRKWNHA